MRADGPLTLTGPKGPAELSSILVYEQKQDSRPQTAERNSFVAVPRGWGIVIPAASRGGCLEYANQHWTGHMAQTPHHGNGGRCPGPSAMRRDYRPRRKPPGSWLELKRYSLEASDASNWSRKAVKTPSRRLHTRVARSRGTACGIEAARCLRADWRFHTQLDRTECDHYKRNTVARSRVHPISMQ